MFYILFSFSFHSKTHTLDFVFYCVSPSLSFVRFFFGGVYIINVQKIGDNQQSYSHNKDDVKLRCYTNLYNEPYNKIINI